MATIENDGVSAETIEVAGVVRDKQGHEWAIPADDTVDDWDEYSFLGKLNFDKAFHYQLVAENKVDQHALKGFVPVTREEVGLPPTVSTDLGKPVTTIVHYMDAVLMKIPKILADRAQARKARTAKTIVDATEPTQEMLARAKAKGQRATTMRETRERLRESGLVVEESVSRTVGDEPAM